VIPVFPVFQYCSHFGVGFLTKERNLLGLPSHSQVKLPLVEMSSANNAALIAKSGAYRIRITGKVWQVASSPFNCRQYTSH
jgi:hypothetical protein